MTLREQGSACLSDFHKKKKKRGLVRFTMALFCVGDVASRL